MGRKEEFSPRFEGAEVLEELLALAGARLDAEGAAAEIREGLSEGKAPGEVFPGLFEGEPRFPDPRIAKRLFENLFGLWEVVRSGKPPTGARPPKPKHEKPAPPPAWGPGGPETEWVEQAWRYLDADARARERLWHSFENRQDALLGWLDDQGLSDDGYAVLRLLLSELSAMIELGSGAPLGAADPEAVEAAGEVPAALWSYAEEALFEAEQDDEAPLSPSESEAVKRLARRGLAALDRARKA